jgi:hypothetical protein
VVNEGSVVVGESGVIGHCGAIMRETRRNEELVTVGNQGRNSA